MDANDETATLKEHIKRLEQKVEKLLLAGNAMQYELQDTDPDVKFDSIKVWKDAKRQ